MSNSVSLRTPAVAAWTRLVRVHQKIDALSEDHFRARGLSGAWFDVLSRIRAREGQTQDDLAASLLVTKGNVSQVLARMEGEDLVERRVDGRCRRLFLTPKGRALADEAVPAQEALLERSLAALDSEEQDQLIRLLRRWEHA